MEAALSHAEDFIKFPLKDEQRRIITKMIDGTSVFALLPTGFGKSVCFYTLPVIKKFVRFDARGRDFINPGIYNFE